MVIDITDSNYDEIVNSGKPVVIDFYAEWCIPCNTLHPVIESLSDEYSGNVIIARCDTEENNELVNKFGIRNVPTLIYLKDGNAVNRTTGAMSKSAISSSIASII